MDDQRDQHMEPPDAPRPGDEAADESQREDRVAGPDAAADADASPESPQAPDEIAASDAGATTPPGGTPLELPAEVAASLTRPPEVPRDPHAHVLPLDGGSQGEPNPVDEIFPPDWRLPEPAVASPRPPEASEVRPEKLGNTMPRVQVLVTLVEARAMYDEAIAEALEKKAPEYGQIAKNEVHLGLWHYENEQRAADWRKRGP